MRREIRRSTSLKPARPAEQWTLPPERLHQRCDPSEVATLTPGGGRPVKDVGAIGQDRAVDALQLGVEMKDPGFNVFVAGLPGTRRLETTRACVDEVAHNRPAPHDWCYVYNFADPYCPLAIDLPARGGPTLAQRMESLIDTARRQIVQAFSSDDYHHQREQISREEHHDRQAVIEQLSDAARRQGFELSISATGVATIPLIDDRPMTDAEFAQLPREKKQELTEKAETLREQIDHALSRIQLAEKATQDRIDKLNRAVAEFVMRPLIRDLKEQYRDWPRVVSYLDQVQEDAVNHVDDFRGEEDQGEEAGGNSLLRELTTAGREAFFDRYKVNVLVSSQDQTTAPVVVETNPTYYNLLGRLEYHARFGVSVTNFRMIKPGALHRANGGYLILQALDVLRNPLAWDALKRALRTGEIQIENMGEQFSATPTASLRPSSIPLDVKVILIGTPQLYYLLYFYDEDFAKLFKVKAEFDTVMERTPNHVAQYASFVRQEVQQRNLRPFDPGAIAAVVDFGSRLAQHQQKITTHFGEIADLVAEASHHATLDGNPSVQAGHVARAIEAKTNRANLIQKKLGDLIHEGTLFIKTEGSRVGEVNGLSIISVGDYDFGLPARITAQTSLGHDGILNVERETKLSGPIHSKGFLILSSFLQGQYAQEKPLALSARITFEQTYDEIDGDSASSTELYALLSSLAGVPLRQDVAVTGSVDQRGEVQPVGGVTSKIEGFFDVCQRRGLTGQQGVIIPAANVQNLMLRDEVVQAVADGRFHIWAVRHVDEGIEILTGVAAGQRQSDGSWEPGSIHALVNEKLDVYAERLKSFGRVGAASTTIVPTPPTVGPRSPRVGAVLERIRRLLTWSSG